MIYDSITQLIGNTPLVRLSKIHLKANNKIFAKCEFFNPAGGIKDRVALYALEQMQKQGKLNAKSVLIEATAGNTGLGVALVALKFSCKVIIVVPDKFSNEKQALMKALGATIINTPASEGMQGAIEKAKELLNSTPNAISLDQFNNKDNPQAHYLNTAQEIYDDLDGKIDYFVCGAGSGGTISGVMKFLKEKNPHIKGVLCDPLSSVIGKKISDECSLIEGIGNCFIPKTMNLNYIDEIIKISNEEAFKALKILTTQEGILAGISSAACLAASLKLCERVQNKNIVTLFADSLSRYISKDWFSNQVFV